MTRRLRTAAVVLLCAVMLGLGGTYAYAGLRGINVVLRNGGIFWISVTAADRRISPSMRLALATEAVGTPGPFQWQSVGAGFDVGELPVMQRPTVCCLCGSTRIATASSPARPRRAIPTWRDG